MDIEKAKQELLKTKKDNEIKAMIIHNNSSNIQIRWSNKDLKEMAEISQRCARENRAIETVLSELEKKEAIINEMAKHIHLSGDYECLNKECEDDESKDCEECIKEYFTNKVEKEGIKE